MEKIFPHLSFNFVFFVLFFFAVNNGRCAKKATVVSLHVLIIIIFYLMLTNTFMTVCLKVGNVFCFVFGFHFSKKTKHDKN